MPESTTDLTPPPRLEVLKRGASGRCPRCKCDQIFITSFRLHKHCPNCELPLEMEDGWSYGSVPLAYILTAVGWGMPILILAVFGILGAQTALFIGIGGAIILPIATYRFTKGLWIGLYYAIIPQELRKKCPDERGDTH